MYSYTTAGKQNTYESILHDEGFVKVFYKALKDATMDNFNRIFMTVISLIMLDDLTSGFNITRNYTLIVVGKEDIYTVEI